MVFVLLMFCHSKDFKEYLLNLWLVFTLVCLKLFAILAVHEGIMWCCLGFLRKSKSCTCVFTSCS